MKFYYFILKTTLKNCHIRDEKKQSNEQKHKDSIAQLSGRDVCSNDPGDSPVKPLWIKKLGRTPNSNTQPDFNAAG